MYKLISKKDNKTTVNRDLSKSEYDEILSIIKNLDDLDYIWFLSTNYVKAKEDFIAFNFSNMDIREIDIYSVMFNSLNAICSNIDLWKKYLSRNYKTDNNIFLNSNGKFKSIFSIKDSEYYDTNVYYCVAKSLRNIITHQGKPYDSIVYYDDYSRHFLIYTQSLLDNEKISSSAKTHLKNSKIDYFDIECVINEAFKVLDSLNEYIFNFLLKYRWISYYDARIRMKDFIDCNADFAAIATINEKYPEEHLLYLKTTNISLNAMRKILAIATKSLMA